MKDVNECPTCGSVMPQKGRWLVCQFCPRPTVLTKDEWFEIVSNLENAVYRAAEASIDYQSIVDACAAFLAAEKKT